VLSQLQKIAIEADVAGIRQVSPATRGIEMNKVTDMEPTSARTLSAGAGPTAAEAEVNRCADIAALYSEISRLRAAVVDAVETARKRHDVQREIGAAAERLRNSMTRRAKPAMPPSAEGLLGGHYARHSGTGIPARASSIEDASAARLAIAPAIVPSAEVPSLLLFSVVIPVHHRTREFREALDSVLAQSLANFEIIIVTNASPAETAAIIEEYKSRDKRVRAFYYPDDSGNANRGRNRGIIEARGDFVSFLDSDDLYFEHTLAHAYDAFRRHNVDVVAGRVSWIVEGSRGTGSMHTGSINASCPVNMAVLMRNNPFMTCAVHVRRDVLLKYGGFRPEQEYLEDLELWLRLAYHGCSFHYSDHIFAQYRLHDSNTELKYIADKERWFDVMWRTYYKPYGSWGV
jgi:GT2 family glycosyltransferase